MTSLTLFLTFVGLLFESSRGLTMKFFAVKLKSRKSIVCVIEV